MTPLTSRQSQILDFIRAEIADRGRPPTVREIAGAFGIRPTNGARDHLIALEKKGAIKVDPLVSRGIRVLEAA